MNMNVVFGLVLGTGLGLGLWILISAIPVKQSTRLSHRLAPYVADISDEAFKQATRRPTEPIPEAFLRYVRGSQTAREGIELLLRQANSFASYEEFIVKKWVWGGLGLALGLTIAGVLFSTGATLSIAVIAVVVLPAFIGFQAVTFMAKKSAQRRIKRLCSELPTVWEFLALSMTAGESLLDALKRLSRTGSGDLTEEFARVIRCIDAGDSLSAALDEMRDRLHIIPLSRGLEQIQNGLHRGTPLSGVLQAQASDAREDAKRELLESAGKKEVGMLIPLVFLILPVTILFAVFPGLLVIQTGL